MSKFYAVMIGTVEVIAEGETYEQCSIRAELVKNWFEGGNPSAPFYIQDFHPSESPRFHMSYHESAVNGSRYIQAFGRIERVPQ